LNPLAGTFGNISGVAEIEKKRPTFSRLSTGTWDKMQQTDSAPFAAYTAAISLRENRRGSEIGMGSNRNHHRSTDIYENYRGEDFRVGFNALQMTVGAISELTAASGPPVR
jgi:hypothetical protein